MSAPTTAPDLEAWALVAAAQQGDTEAFGQLYERYRAVVFRFALYRVGDKPLAEDVTSETFLRALRKITTVSYRGRDVGAWFTTIARNIILDHVKSSRYRLEIATADIFDAETESSDNPAVLVAEAAIHAELHRCIAQLSEDQQECVDLRFLRGLSVAETCAVMGRNEGAVKALTHRATRRLHHLMPEGAR